MDITNKFKENKMNKFLIMTISLVLVFLSVGVSASEVIARSAKFASGDCSFQENVSMNVSFRGTVEKAAKVTELVSGKENEIKSIASEVGIDEIKIQSQNFNININMNRNYGNNYQYSGNINIVLGPYEKALVLLDELKERNYQASLNVSRYQQGNTCN